MVSHQPPDYQCPFCALLNSSPSSKNRSVIADIVHRGENATALISLHQLPNNPGNTIIIPNQHYENIFDLPVELSIHIHTLARAVALAMKQAFQCDGITLRQHNEPAGNQDVWHYHVHVTPRFVNDNFYSSNRESYRVMPADERAKLAQMLGPSVKTALVIK